MIYVYTRKGKHHRISEDTALVGDVILSDENDVLPIPGEGFICIADGVGGNSGGSCASSFVTESLSAIRQVVSLEQLKDILTEINVRLIQKGKEDASLSAMASTLTGVYLDSNKRFLIHIGNTRCYTLQGCYLKQITQDHTLCNWLKSVGRFDDAMDCNKNEITNCFGGGNASLLSKLYVSEMPPFKKLLLTSDGVHDYVSVDLLEAILAGSVSGEESCRQIADAALAAGSEDDISVILVDMQEFSNNLPSS